MPPDDEDDERLATALGLAMPFGALAGVVFGVLVDNVGLGIALGIPGSIVVAALLHRRRGSGDGPPDPASP